MVFFFSCLKRRKTGYNNHAQSIVHRVTVLSKAMVTIREIAEKAGVSPGSVSAVLSGKAQQRRIAVATQQRVEAVATELGYRHNALARSLRVGKSDLIGIIGHSHLEFHTVRARAAARAFIEAGYQIVMQDLAWRPEKEADVIKEILSLQPEGLFIESGAGTPGTRDEAFHLLNDQAQRGFPIVRLDTSKGLKVDVVDVDREHGAYLATCHLAELGHRRIAHLIDPGRPIPALQARIRGFERACLEHGINSTDATIVPIHITGVEERFDLHMAGYRGMRQVLESQLDTTAVFTTDDYIALGAVNAALEAGVRVPDDIAVMGFSGFPEGRYCAVPLSTMAFPFENMAQTAAQMLLERVGGLQSKPRTVTLTPELVVRRSCGANPNYQFSEISNAIENSSLPVAIEKPDAGLATTLK